MDCPETSRLHVIQTVPLQHLIRSYFLKHYYFLVGQFLRYVERREESSLVVPVTTGSRGRGVCMHMLWCANNCSGSINKVTAKLVWWYAFTCWGRPYSAIHRMKVSCPMNAVTVCDSWNARYVCSTYSSEGQRKQNLTSLFSYVFNLLSYATAQRDKNDQQF